MKQSDESSRYADEAEHVARVLAGDRGAFRPLVERFESAVFGLCRKLLGAADAELEDTCQEAFLRAFRSLGELHDHRRFGPWLCQIARSLAHDRLRRRLAERRALEARVRRERWLSVGHDGSDDVEGILADMPPEERQALELKYFDGLSYHEIARRIGRTFSQVDHLIRDARARLARRLEFSRRCSGASPVGTRGAARV